MSESRFGLCVLRDEVRCEMWTVGRCQGGGRREVVQQFSSFHAAADFALSERERLSPEVPVDVHFPDDCPCPTSCEHA